MSNLYRVQYQLTSTSIHQLNFGHLSLGWFGQVTLGIWLLFFLVDGLRWYCWRAECTKNMKGPAVIKRDLGQNMNHHPWPKLWWSSIWRPGPSESMCVLIACHSIRAFVGNWKQPQRVHQTSRPKVNQTLECQDWPWVVRSNSFVRYKMQRDTVLECTPSLLELYPKQLPLASLVWRRVFQLPGFSWSFASLLSQSRVVGAAHDMPLRCSARLQDWTDIGSIKCQCSAPERALLWK